MKIKLLFLGCFILANLTIHAVVFDKKLTTNQEESILEKAERDAFDRFLKLDLLETHRKRLAYLLEFMIKTGNDIYNLEMPSDGGLSSAAEFFKRLDKHPEFANHPEKEKFIPYSEILQARSHNFLHFMRRDSTSQSR